MWFLGVTNEPLIHQVVTAFLAGASLVEGAKE